MGIAIIPARGGSKRIPRKNVKNFHGKPIIVWSIEAALESQCIDKVIVSTDDEEIAAIAISAGAEVPFIRDAQLSDDYATTTDVIVDSIERLEAINIVSNYYCCLYATAPLIAANAIRLGFTKMQENKCNFAFSATSYSFPIQRAFKLSSLGRVEMFEPSHRLTRSQDLEAAYHDAGQFYWGTKMAWLEKRNVFGEYSIPIILPRHQVQDIDTPEDWELAEKLFSLYRLQEK